MAKSIRVSVGFQSSTHKAIEDLAAATGQSFASIVSEFMDEAAPSFGDIAKAIQLAKKKPVQALDIMAERLAVATQQAAQIGLDLVESRKRHNKRRVPK